MINRFTIAFMLMLPYGAVASSHQSIIASSYGMHIIQLLMAVMLATILLRSSIGHQRRLNWFFGAIAVIYIASNLQVFQRFFASPGSVMHYAYNLVVLFVYFFFYCLKTWKK